MSKFSYKAEGELNSQYLLDLLKEYLSQLSSSNDTNGIVEDDYKINTNSNRFVKWFKDTTKRLFKPKDALENYNRVLATKYIDSINKKIDIFLETNVLTSRQFLDLKQTLQAIHFDNVLPLIDEYRESAIRSSERRFLKVLNDIKYLNHANTNYILYNSPVSELKPFLSDKVSSHQANYKEIQKLAKQFLDCNYSELNNFELPPAVISFKAKPQDFYNDNIADNGIGEDVEKFIRSKMLEKIEISKHEELLQEDLDNKIAQIDMLLKRLKVNKIEKMMQELIVLKTNLAQAKEVIDNCKEVINSSTIINKSHIFLVMDNLFYKLSQKCETLQQKIKFKLQLVDKVKMFNMLETLQEQQGYESRVNTLPRPNVNNSLNSHKMQNNATLNRNEATEKTHIASNLYDDDEEASEIHITEDDGESQAEDEIVIDEDK